MDTHTQKFKVRLGLFIIGGLALFAMAIFIIGKQQNLFNPVFKITAKFYNVSGLKIGSNIRFSGIDVGIVDNIKIINDSRVQVDMLIRKDVQRFIKSDCEVTIGSEGIIGDRILIITQGSFDAPIVKDKQKIASKEPVEIDAIIASLQISGNSIEIISKQLSEVMIKVNSGRGTLGRLIHDSTIAQNIKHTILNFKKASEGLDEAMEKAKQSIFDITDSLQVTSVNTKIISNELAEIMIEINSGNGTLGRLIHDSTIAENLDQAIINLKNSSYGLNENMNAAKENFLLKGYFKRKEKAAEEMRDDALEKKAEEAEEQKANDEEK